MNNTRAYTQNYIRIAGVKFTMFLFWQWYSFEFLTDRKIDRLAKLNKTFKLHEPTSMRHISKPFNLPTFLKTSLTLLLLILSIFINLFRNKAAEKSNSIGIFRNNTLTDRKLTVFQVLLRLIH